MLNLKEKELNDFIKHTLNSHLNQAKGEIVLAIKNPTEYLKYAKLRAFLLKKFTEKYEKSGV